jgi:hypothetical protein
MSEIKQDTNVLLQVAPGTHVEVELMVESGASERLSFDVVEDAQADFAHGFLGLGTPLAQAILGKPAGSIVPYHVGDVVQVCVLKVTQAARAPEDDVAAKRQAVVQEVVAHSDRITDMAFALAVGSKWGDYDPGAPKE